MKRTRFTEDQIIGVLREHEAGAAALRALHEAAAPGVRRGVPDGSEGRQSCRRSEHTVRQCKSRLQREASGSSSHAPSYSMRMVSVPRTRLLLSHPIGVCVRPDRYGPRSQPLRDDPFGRLRWACLGRSATRPSVSTAVPSLPHGTHQSQPARPEGVPCRSPRSDLRNRRLTSGSADARPSRPSSSVENS